ncbi:hypothetical protein FYZ44_02075 [Mobiluncus mulieris]|nr:hypothetical protein [Mobiluncus mulieris]
MLWVETAGLAMFCPVFLSNKLLRKTLVKHESPYVVSSPASALARVCANAGDAPGDPSPSLG